jgi:hypothetical protein
MHFLTQIKKKLRRSHDVIIGSKRYFLKAFFSNDLNRSFKLDLISKRQPLYVFFAPEASIKTHFLASCILAFALKKKGHQVLIVKCFDSYKHCLVADMSREAVDKNPFERARLCVDCSLSGNRILERYNLPWINIGNVLTKDDFEFISDLVKKMPSDASKFVYEGITFGRLCALDLALFSKKIDQLKVTGLDRSYLEAYVEAALTSYLAFNKIKKIYNIRGLLYFNEYSILMGAALAAKKNNVSTTRISYAIHEGIDPKKIILMPEMTAVENYHLTLSQWKTWRKLAISPDDIELITDNQLSRMKSTGFATYSPEFRGEKNDIFKSLGLQENRKTLIAFTASLDEFFANKHLMATVGKDLFQKKQPFPDQVVWLKELIAYVEESEDLQLVVRVHPREGKNKRETVVSEHLGTLIKHFSLEYKNTQIVWPEDNVSSYDLAEIADLSLTSWSNISSETARLGVPTIMAFKRVNPFPVDDMVGWAPDPASYFELIRRTLSTPPSLDSIRYAYRWSHCAFLSSYVDVSDLYEEVFIDGQPSIKEPCNSKSIEDVIVKRKFIQASRQKELQKKQCADADSVELSSLQAQLRRVLWYLVTGDDRNSDYYLALNAKSTAPTPEMLVKIDGQNVVVSINQRVFKKRSNAIARLAPLIVSKIK